MKWVVVAIVVFIVGYTYINLRYRKPGPGFRPYEDMNNRATTVRLLAAGWHRIPVDTRRPADKAPGTEAAIKRGSAGMGTEFAACFAEKPKLLATIDRVSARDDVARGSSYTVYFTGSVPDQELQLGSIDLYFRGQEIILLPQTEDLPGKRLLSRWPDADYCVSFPTQALPPGKYEVRLVARGPAAQWTFTVR